MNQIVQKFGGTSLGNAERLQNVAKIIKTSLEEAKVIVTVSAMNSYTKSEGTTSKLIQASQEALNKGPYIKLIEQIEESHLQAITDAVSLEKERVRATEEVLRVLKHLKSFLGAIEIIGEISPKSEDVILSTGEKLCAAILAATLNSIGVEAEYVDFGTMIQEPFKATNHSFYTHAKTVFSRRLKECGSKLPVVTGFFGHVPNGILKGIGRGYTDFTAALIAASLKADELQIWKEVDGIFSADPRIVEKATVLTSVLPEEAAELTYYGSEVLHPFTMEQAIKEEIPIRIKNTFAPELQGTVITPHKCTNEVRPLKKPTAVTCKRNVTIINIHSNRMMLAHGFMAKIFQILEKYDIIIDLISTSEVNVSLTVDHKVKLDNALTELKAMGQVFVRKNMAIISLVGKSMHLNVGMAGKMLTAVSEENINIEMISQGASEINISCVVKDESAHKALRSIHEKMIEI